MSGHTTERIFRSYFSTLNEELVEFASPLFDEVSKDDGNVIDKPITPAPHHEKTHLLGWAKPFLKKEDCGSVFKGFTDPPNPEYFKTLWGRYKAKSKLLKQGQTLYSFRHSGAIEIFKRTGSIHKLQRAMGHSSLNVSLTYLRGLEVAELNEEDMPMT